jgi:ATPase subunit of ABC transporter with duplicated ATPase domains
MQPKQVWEEASRLRRNYKVARRIDELLKVARTEDVTNLGREIRRTIDLQQEALAAGNHNASAAYQRMLMTTVGALERRLVLTVESSLSDKELIERLSGGDPERLAAARVLLGAPDHFTEPVETRH